LNDLPANCERRLGFGDEKGNPNKGDVS